jgi:hypothetical protein
VLDCKEKEICVYPMLIPEDILGNGHLMESTHIRTDLFLKRQTCVTGYTHSDYANSQDVSGEFRQLTISSNVMQKIFFNSLISNQNYSASIS